MQTLDEAIKRALATREEQAIYNAMHWMRDYMDKMVRILAEEHSLGTKFVGEKVSVHGVRTNYLDISVSAPAPPD